MENAMTEPYMDHTNELLQDSPQVVSKPWRRRWCGTWKRLVFVVILAGFCGLMLTGCEGFWDSVGDLFRINGGDAEAQDQSRTRIETHAIATDTFRIVLDNDDDITPSFIVRDGATEFTMQSEGNLSFDTADGSDEDIELEVNDVIILRPNGTTGTFTLIRAD